MGIFASKETRTLGGNENKNNRLANDFIIMFEKLEPPVSTECRIYKVPYYLRKLNEEAYTPRVISIGPIHHGKKRFQTMEKHKVRYFKRFIDRYQINLELLASAIRGMEGSIRCCYVETVQMESDDFVKMIMLDASFILNLFLKPNSEEPNDSMRVEELDDPMRVEEWMLAMVWHELLLLENQLPIFVIEKLYRLILPSLSNPTSLMQLTFDFFKQLNIYDKSHHVSVEIQHFTDLLRFFQLPPQLPTRVVPRSEVSFPKYSITQLHEAGVEFKVIERFLDLKFEKGVLEIPRLEFSDWTEIFIRNIMALEQCDRRKKPYITDFYIILDNLINTTKDVDFLCEKRILINNLGDSDTVTSMINKLNREIIVRDFNFDFCQLSIGLNTYYEEPRHKLKATLRHEYFSTPWRSTSTIAAIILLMLTFGQTIFSILQVFLKPN